MWFLLEQQVCKAAVPALLDTPVTIQAEGLPYSVADAFTEVGHGTGTHFHTVPEAIPFVRAAGGLPNMVPLPYAEVGGYFGDELVRGLVEFPIGNLVGATIQSASLQFQVADLLTPGILPPPGIGGVQGQDPPEASDPLGVLMDVRRFEADELALVSDFESVIAGNSFTFDAGGRSMHDVISGDVTANAKMQQHEERWGFAVVPGSDMTDPDDALTFDRFVLTVTVTGTVYNVGTSGESNSDTQQLFWGMDTARGSDQAYFLNQKARLEDFSTIGDKREMQSAQVVTLNGTTERITISSGAASGVTAGANRTYSLWFKTAETGHRTLFEIGPGGANSDILAINQGGTNQFSFFDGVSWHNAAATITDNAWHQAAVAINGTSATLWVDGAKLDTVTISSHTFTEAQVLIGDGNASSQEFPGSLSDVRLYTATKDDSYLANLAKWTKLYARGADLEAHWAMNDRAGPIVQDGTGNGHTGAITSAAIPTVRATDKTCPSAGWADAVGFTQSRRFSGDGGLHFGDTNKVTGSALTVFFWFRSLNPGTGTRYIVSKASASLAQGYHVHASGSNIVMGVGTGSSQTFSQATTWDGKWKSYCGVYDGADIKWYVDGVLAGTSGSITGSIADTTAGFRLGEFSGGGNRVTGNLLNVRVYSAVKDAGEVLALHNGTKDEVGAEEVYLDSVEYVAASQTIIGEVNDRHSISIVATSLTNIPVVVAGVNDIRGIPATYTGRVPRSPILETPIVTLDGVDDEITIGNIGSVTSCQMRVKQLVDNQVLLTLQDSTATAVSVSGGDLTFGASITNPTNIMVDGYGRTATEAGTLLNDNGWHLVSFDFDSISASDLRVGTDSSAFGNFSISQLSFDSEASRFRFNEGNGPIVHDDGTGNNEDHGTITTGVLSEVWANTGPADISRVNTGGMLARYFDGSSYYRGTVTEFRPRSTFEIVVAFLIDTAAEQVLLDARPVAGQGIGLLMDATGSVKLAYEGFELLSTGTYADGKWHVARAHYDGSNVYLSVDRDTRDSAAFTGQITASTLVSLGTRSFSTAADNLTGYLRGGLIRMDGVVFDVTISSKTHAAMGADAIVVADYRDGDGRDISERRRHMTATGSPAHVWVPGLLASTEDVFSAAATVGKVSHRRMLTEGQTTDPEGGQPDSYYANLLQTDGVGVYAPGDGDQGTMLDVRTDTLSHPEQQSATDERILIFPPSPVAPDPVEEAPKITVYTEPPCREVSTADDLSVVIGELANVKGACIIMQPGTYVQNIVINTRFRFVAKDPADRPIIQPTSGRPLCVIAGESGNASRSEFHDIIFDAVNAEFDAAALDCFNTTEWLEHLLFDTCDFLNASFPGPANVMGVISRGQTRNLTFRNCLIADNSDGHGMYLKGPGSIVDNCVVRDSGQFGIHMFPEETAGFTHVRPDACTIKNSEVYDNGHVSPLNRGYGMIVQSNGDHVINGNVVYGNKEGGLRLNNTKDTECTGNDFFDSGTRPADGETFVSQFPISEVNVVTYVGGSPSNTHHTGLSRPGFLLRDRAGDIIRDRFGRLITARAQT